MLKMQTQGYFIHSSVKLVKLPEMETSTCNMMLTSICKLVVLGKELHEDST